MRTIVSNPGMKRKKNPPESLRRVSCFMSSLTLKSGVSWVPGKTAKNHYLQVNKTPAIYPLACGPA